MEFKRCPKCGGKLWRVSVLDTDCGYKVYCRQCRASTKEHRTKEDAINAWNNRQGIKCGRCVKTGDWVVI